MKKILYLFTLLASFIPLYSFALTDLSIQLSPKTPTPYSQVTLTLQSYTTNVTTASVTWYVDGKEVKKGIGEKSITVTTKGIGTSSLVKARVGTQEGDILEASVTITPQNLELAWEALESYTPPLYEGKALPSYGSSVRVTALSNIYEGKGIVSPNSLSYSWYVDGSYLENASGANKQSAIIELDVLRESTEVTLRVRSLGGTVTEKTITIYPHQVIPILYPYDPTLGTTLTTAFSKRIETAQDIILSLQPFYLSTKSGLGNTASYTWLLDGLPVTPEEKTVLALRPQANTVGSRKLFITTENSARRLQKSELSTEIIFDSRR